MNTATSPFKALDLRQAEFVRLFVEGAHPRQAALGAGYARATAEAAGEQLLQRPNIALAIARLARPRLARSIPLSISTLEWLRDNAKSERVRMESATRLLDRAGLLPKAQDPVDEFEKPLHTMPLEELRATVERYESELAHRATPIEATEVVEFD